MSFFLNEWLDHYFHGFSENSRVYYDMHIGVAFLKGRMCVREREKKKGKVDIQA
ncbi:hypothetical protein COCC4DRAFT_33755 [Bipolaris maydis ATCC 48331]|uniref:Uncharacterized protein n=1 Tax=Cochliobolus heterostrophus (strain C4 / ATCC 48331 / race T) TaxID=665024 RepID=N4WQK7_COCH4|nr:uncharacterized protein COCC4DRAFT_33755 [Bipolaris maydis ATCC 48331]ENI01695.1 hypothetical protein COCC4DRAFT_33755 [Bipolaris maydis ATCC 48331]